jgi:hypothetical protein
LHIYVRDFVWRNSQLRQRGRSLAKCALRANLRRSKSDVPEGFDLGESLYDDRMTTAHRIA